MKNLNFKAWLGLALLALAMALLLFGSAGTVHYWQAWLYLVVFIGGCALTTLYLIENDPALLQRRLSGGPFAEKHGTQKIIMLLASIGFIALLVVPALARRLGWPEISAAIVIFGDVLVAVGLYVVFLVYKENSFTSATIQIVEDQRVISTGPYALVRHPMYGGGLLYCLGTPLALGSYWGLLPFAIMTPVLIWRLVDEERFLASALPGYADYLNRVRWRLIPGLF